MDPHVFDGRYPLDLTSMAEDPYLGHFKPPARLLMIVRGSTVAWGSAIDCLVSAAAHCGDWCNLLLPVVARKQGPHKTFPEYVP